MTVLVKAADHTKTLPVVTTAPVPTGSITADAANAAYVTITNSRTGPLAAKITTRQAVACTDGITAGLLLTVARFTLIRRGAWLTADLFAYTRYTDLGGGMTAAIYSSVTVI